jgi:hypothetical protein
MKTVFTANVKDSIGAIAIIGCIFASAVAGIASSQHANVNAAPATIYKMDVIEVTAPRMKTERMPTIVVTASRTEGALVAANGNVNAAF